MRLHVETHGSGSPALVLLHGLGANGAVWGPLLERLRPRFDELRRLAPDVIELPGLGHNLQVESPDALVQLIEQRLL
jgi:pimeloyl-ACP methyl ester carboxylesterase